GTARERAVAATVIVLAWAGGIGLERIEWTAPRAESVSVALVQGAVPQSIKWQPGQREQTLRLYRELTEPHFGADIIVWPEAALPALEQELRPFLDALAARATFSGSSLVMGLLRRDPASGAYYNAMAAWGPAEQWYYKRRLVPFGEFFPVPDAVREWMRLMNLPYSDFEPGAAEQPPLEAGGERLAPTICYEDAYGAEQLRLARQSSLLVNVTNDAWFGDSTAPHQHLDISRMRSLETGRPMLRATNDGVTALIAHDGRLLATLPQFQAGVLTGVIEPRAGTTPYMRLGNYAVLALVGVGLLAGFRASGRIRS
ncbi:MAG TPA: apolipoprotein N-acyltransferase, partial [Steroidobacteraceae bacterium]|nr:apolipoprotein N-acyltransferase [Steroidobacteraceae bacterium]